jgi:phage shock protein PspC (stress-responsive transcriptional regulator)
MNFDKIKGVIGGLAPTLGAALGGPVGGAAATMLADVLGCDPAPQKIERALQQATPEQIAEIKKAELDFEARMKELDVDIFALETADKQDARKSFAKDWTAKLIAITMVAFFCGYIGMITIMPPEQNSMELINLVLGYLGGLVSAVISFYFGASHRQE